MKPEPLPSAISSVLVTTLLTMLAIILLTTLSLSADCKPLLDDEGHEVVQPNFKKAYDIYLTQDRVCRRCTGKFISNTEVELSNKKGAVGTYLITEILGVDNHPIRRKLFLQSARGIGFPARIIVPQAFNDEEKYLHY